MIAEQLRRIVEATTVASMEGPMNMNPRPNRRADRRQQMPVDDAKMQMMEPRPVEGRSLRNASAEARLGAGLSGVDQATLIFEHAGEVVVEAPVDNARKDGGMGHAGHKMKHGQTEAETN